MAEPTSAQLARACREVLPEGVCHELEIAPLEEALGHAISLLIEQGIRDPEKFLRERGILD